ncbi:MAG: SDR family oxidoreductase, partial [Calditrichaeota bacterium]
MEATGAGKHGCGLKSRPPAGKRCNSALRGTQSCESHFLSLNCSPEFLYLPQNLVDLQKRESTLDLNLKDNVVMITGGSRGIGKAIALAFAREGARLSLCARTEQTLQQAAKEIEAVGGPVFHQTADVTSTDEAAAFVEATLSHYGRIDVLVNNVGGSRRTPTLEISDEEWHELLDLNAVTAARMSRLVIPAMKTQGHGVIIMISSIYGRESGGHITYNAGKAAEISLAKTLAREFAPDNIRVLSVAPGSILFEGGSWWRKQQA